MVTSLEQGVNVENDPMLLTDSSDSEEDIFTSSNGRSSGDNKLKRGGNECKINEGAIYAFMRFPRSFATECPSPAVHIRQDYISACDVEFPTLLGSIDQDFVESLITLTGDNAAKRLKSEEMVSYKQMKAAVLTNILLRVAYSVAEARFLDCSSFRLLDKIFMEFMKDEVKTKEEQESQQFEFKPRAIKIDNILELDISSLGNIVSNEIFSEWQEFLSKEESTDETKVEALEDECNLLHESVLKDIVHIHNSVYGSEDLVQSPGSIKISEADRLYLFEDSYSLGVKMIRSLKGASQFSLDAKLSPEHLLHRSLDQKKNFIVSRKPIRAYNFYKDSNAHVMDKMMKLLDTLKEHILIHMPEWDDHPAFKKVLNVIDMILAIPPSTPLAKALMALQFLLNRVQIMSETVPNFSLTDQLEPILALVLSWSKLEFESWTGLLDEVQSQYEINAEKLWLPLYSTLRRAQPADLKSLRNFMCKSNIGEFRKHLQLLFAMHGHIKTGIAQKSYSSPTHTENEKILYFVFGLFVQSLPSISEYIHDVRRSIETELKVFVGQWEQCDPYYMGNSKQNRQKFKSIIQKYNDKLQQPLMITLQEIADRRGMESPIVQDLRPRFTFHLGIEDLENVLKQTHFSDEERSAWIDMWKRETDAAVKNLQVVRTTKFGFPNSSEVTRIMECLSSLSSCNEYKEERRKVWLTIRKMYENVIACRVNWKEESSWWDIRSALCNLYKDLDSCGLSTPGRLFRKYAHPQPSYDMQHLLLADGMPPVNDNEKLLASLLHSMETEWRSANQYFFRCFSPIYRLDEIYKKPHRDFTTEEVLRTAIHLYSLVVIQEDQRSSAYKVSACLERLKKSILPLENLFSGSDPFASDSISFPKNQHATFNCMWQQKQLFDGSCTLLNDISLLLRTVESSDLDTCQKVETKLLSLVEESVLHFQKSKDLLDDYLLGKDRIVTSVEVKLQPNAVTKQMEQFVLENFGVVREYKERVSELRKHDVDRGSVVEILFGHLESIYFKEKAIAEEYESALQSGNHSDHMDEDSDGFVSGFVQTLEQILKDIVDPSDILYVTETNFEVISTWNVIFRSNIDRLKLDEICHGVAKTIQFAFAQGNIVNRGHATHLKSLYILLDAIVTYGHGLLLDFLVMHRAVSQISDEITKLFVSLYTEGFPISYEKRNRLMVTLA